jgi:hypothetical protein
MSNPIFIEGDQDNQHLCVCVSHEIAGFYAPICLSISAVSLFAALWLKNKTIK